MKVGKFKHRIEIWGKQEITNEFFETDYENAKLKTIWAQIIPQTGNMQRSQADTILTNCTHKIIVRYNAGKTIKNDDWIMFRGKRFDIRYILEPYFANESLEIFVEEITT